MGGVGLAASGALVDMVPGEDVKKSMQELFDLQFIPAMIQLAISLFVSPMLIAASIGCLTRKSWSQGLMKISLLGSILSSVVGLGVAAWMLLFHWDKIVAPSVAQGQPEWVAVSGQLFGMGISVLVLCFFIWALIAMGGKKIVAFYDQINSNKDR